MDTKNNSALNYHSFDKKGVCSICGCSASAVQKFNFACKESGNLAAGNLGSKMTAEQFLKAKPQGTNLLKPACWISPICFVLGWLLLLGADEDSQKAAGIIALYLIFGSMVIFALAWIIDDFTQSDEVKAERERREYKQALFRREMQRARRKIDEAEKLDQWRNRSGNRGIGYGKLTAVASIYAARQLRQINEKLDQADSGDGSDLDSGDGSDFGGF